ncbi:MAG: endonuclease III [Candidatus Omnitrophota bacterium]|nr:endonuclease III [Candidatus Omnitrophota bacterium]
MNKILRILREAYGVPPRRPRSDSIDEIIRTILSQNTSDINSLKAFAELKRHFSSWSILSGQRTSKIASVIRHAGLANIKAKRIKEVLAEIKHREGRLSLGCLAAMDAESALHYLRSIKGVGPKTAACVLLFSFGKPVMPVDTHIYRVTKRLGLIPWYLSIETAHEFLTRTAYEELVPRRGLLRKPCSGSSPELITAGLIYSFHLGIIEHGRKTCKAQNPKCGVCLLYGLCGFKYKAIYKKEFASARRLRRRPRNDGVCNMLA